MKAQFFITDIHKCLRWKGQEVGLKAVSLCLEMWRYFEEEEERKKHEKQTNPKIPVALVRVAA